MSKVYYRKNSQNWRKGGKYYKYIPISDRASKPIIIKHGVFILTFE